MSDAGPTRRAERWPHEAVARRARQWPTLERAYDDLKTAARAARGLA
jgi:hypothetical protein